MKILIVEDNALSMSMVKTVIGDIVDAEIITAADGHEALETFKSSAVGEIQMIITDLIMPGMSGVEETRAIRALGREDSKTVPIVALSAYHAEANVELAEEAGVTEFIGKPYNRDELIAVVRKYIK